MASVQSQVMDAVVAALNLTAWSAYRTRVESFNPAELPAYNVLPGKGDARYLSTDEVTRTFRFTVRHMALAVDQVDCAIDALYVAGSAAFLSDPTLGGLVRYTSFRTPPCKSYPSPGAAATSPMWSSICRTTPASRPLCARPGCLTTPK